MVPGNDTYHLMIDEIEDYAILLLDANGYIMNWNKGAEKIKGYTAKEIIGKKFSLFYTAEDRDKKLPERLIEKAALKGKAVDEGWRVRKDGTRFWGSILITAIHGEDNKVVGFSKVTRDLTGKKNAEELERSLGQTKEGLLKMFNASPSGMIMVDIESRTYIDVNKNFLTTFGYTRDEVVGLTLADLSIVSVEIREKLFTKLQQHGYFKNEEVLGHSKDGKEITCIVSADSFEMDGRKYILYVIHDISDIKELERKVSESEEKFKKMFQSIAAGITITRLSDSKYSDVNDAFVQITGYSRGELIGHSSVELGIIVNIEKREEVLQQIKEQGSIRHFEATIRHKSGKTLEVLSSIDTILLDKEKYAINVIYDITERKKAEEIERALVQTKEGLMKMFNASPSGMIIADIESGRMLEVNNSFLTIFGHTREDAIGLTADELGFVSNETQQKSFGKLKKQGYLRNENVPCLTKEGNKLDTIFSVELFEMDGKQCFLCIFHDITEIKEMERKLVESENKYRKIIEEAGDVLYTADAQGIFTYINKRVKVLTGYTDEELLGKHFSVLIAPEWQAKIRDSYREQFKHKMLESVMEFIIRTKKGPEKWVEQVVIMQLENGFIKGFQCIVRDITERKKANLLLAEQKHIIEQKNKDILDSINYAKRIQDAIFPPEDLIKELLPQSFILFKPKDIISGDFYWIEKFDNKTYIAAVDCTGHGVPGALLSIVGYNLLSKSINEHEYSKPNDILNEVSSGINRTLRQTIEGSGVKDTMDIALCSIDRITNILEFAGAYNSMYLIRGNQLIEIPADRFPVGVFLNGELQKFTNQQMQLEKGDMLYLFSDGYPDQFGGPKGKKLKYKGFQEILLSIHHLPLNDQKEILDRTLEEWKWMTEEQTDDILVIGIRI
ncbi:MAG TPA: PAS domain S-box protein [Bacteroidia bacterium]|jgi:PAS domain S-box-containing protein|nr:PAS domain S-box protein [Bacteroidia bacterium]